MNSLSHPNFDTNLPHQAVLTTTGDLIGNARLAAQNLNWTIEETYRRRPIFFWTKVNLIDHFLEHGLGGMLRATAEGYVEYGRFLLLYGRALQGTISVREIESYSRQWLNSSINPDQRLLRSAIEAEVLSRRCVEQGHLYEAVIAQLALLRVLCSMVYTDEGTRLGEAHEQVAKRLNELCTTYVNEMHREWNKHRNLLKVATLDVTTYLVHCARIMEIAGLAYFTTTDETARAQSAAFLADFSHNEPGCCHPLSDHHAVSLVLAALVLIDSHRHEVVSYLLRHATAWLCDRYEDGMGLAGLEDDEAGETKTLLGYAFDFVDLPQPAGSFLATTLSDLAAFLGDPLLYADIVNDIKASSIHPEYWQPRDSIGACHVEGADVLHYPSVPYSDVLSHFTAFQFAAHMPPEIDRFRFSDAFGPEVSIMLMVLLRDRYFPKLWPLLVSRDAMSAPEASANLTEAAPGNEKTQPSPSLGAVR